MTALTMTRRLKLSHGLPALILLFTAGCALTPMRRPGVTGRLYDGTLEQTSTLVRQIASQEGLLIERDGPVNDNEWRLTAAGGRQASNWTRVYVTVKREAGASRVLIDEHHTRANAAAVMNNFAARIYAQLDRELRRK